MAMVYENMYVLRIIFTVLVLWSKICIDQKNIRMLFYLSYYLSGKHQNIDLKREILVILEA